MTLAGTRPPTVDEWEQYELHHRSRMSTKPGMPIADLLIEDAKETIENISKKILLITKKMENIMIMLMGQGIMMML